MKKRKAKGRSSLPFTRPHAITLRLSAAEFATLNEMVLENGLARADILRLALRQYCATSTADDDALRDLSAAFGSDPEPQGTSTPAPPEPGPTPECQAGVEEA